MGEENEMFSNRQLKNMIIPLFMEQLLLMLVGLADTVIVSYCGEAAVSGVSLVNSFNTIFIYLFTALASGGAVVVSQYLGKGERETASEAISQLLMVSTLFSVTVTLVILWLHEPILLGLFGRVEPAVMEACTTYLKISAYSYPAIAVYNAGAALYRSIGKVSTTMYIAIASNLINIVGNCMGVFWLDAGVAGVAWPSLISRAFSAVVVTALCFGRRHEIGYKLKWIFKWNGRLQKTMLKIAVPNGVESGVFQLVKVALSSVVALFGTYQIAANGIAQSIWSVASLVAASMGPVFITVIGQCMGACEITQAEHYFKKLTKITVIFSAVWNLLIFALTPLALIGFAVSDKTKRLVLVVVLLHNLFSATAFPFADPLGKGLRATGDIKFTTAISIFTTVGIRLVFSALFAIVLNMGIVGITTAMCLDWVIRGVIFWIRFQRGNWKSFRVINERKSIKN